MQAISYTLAVPHTSWLVAAGLQFHSPEIAFPYCRRIIYLRMLDASIEFAGRRLVITRGHVKFRRTTSVRE